MISAQLTTADGHLLAADLVVPQPTARAAVVLCHPHPRFGGNRFNIVVSALFAALPRSAFATLRFDFRSDGGDAIAERADLVAALDRLDEEAELDGLERAVVGYSFGAVVACGTDDPRIAAIAAIAPPFGRYAVADPGRTTLVLTPRHDQFAPPPVAETAVADWQDATFETIESADHFLSGHTAAVADRVVTWLSERLPPIPSTEGTP